MLSILIPVYNFSVSELVAELHQQAVACAIPFEIRCYDDGSSSAFKEQNASISSLANVIYTELPKNVGRSRIRNMLATDAAYEQLLFMDCDSQVLDGHFIARYLEHASEHKLVYGGRAYPKSAPEDAAQYLRWHYGVSREVSTAETRSEDPYKSFMTNNFLVPKAIFLSIKLDERLEGYGHEDTLFGQELKAQGIEIVHIDNALVHIGLEPADEFLDKTAEGVRNLAFLIRDGKVTGDVKLYRYYKALKRTGMLRPMATQLRKNREKVREQLRSANPDLRKFDLYKLDLLIEALNTDQ